MEIKVYSEEEILSKSTDRDNLDLKNPARYFIYFLVWGGKVVYVGKSVNPEVRIKTHIAEQKKTFDSYAIFECDDEAELDMMENVHIVAYAPMFNKNISIRKIGEGIRESLSQGRQNA